MRADDHAGVCFNGRDIDRFDTEEVEDLAGRGLIVCPEVVVKQDQNLKRVESFCVV
jgi:hypothetical protein